MVAAVGDQRDINLSKITPTSWPASCPSKYEESILTIVCGNTHLQWALHDGVGKEFMPHLFWRLVIVDWLIFCGIWIWLCLSVLVRVFHIL